MKTSGDIIDIVGLVVNSNHVASCSCLAAICNASISRSLTCIGSYVNHQVTTFTVRAQATTCSKHHTRKVMDASVQHEYGRITLATAGLLFWLSTSVPRISYSTTEWTDYADNGWCIAWSLNTRRHDSVRLHWGGVFRINYHVCVSRDSVNAAMRPISMILVNWSSDRHKSAKL